jgi:hypothetical protein
LQCKSGLEGKFVCHLTALFYEKFKCKHVPGGRGLGVILFSVKLDLKKE